jgi:carboxyl-terminal processing protease
MINATMKKFKVHILISGLIFLTLFTGFYYFSDDNVYLKINRSIDLFGKIYREVTFNYVDDIDPEKFMEAGINGMLSELDPYTVYIDEKKNDDIDLIQTGKYAGVGITVGMRDDCIVIISLMEGYSAQKKGLMPGDKILEIAGVSMLGKKVDDVREYVRGDPGTDVKIIIEREGESKHLEFILQREEIQLKNVTYYSIIHDNIGYIRLERFSRSAGDEVRRAVKDLKSRGNLSGLILDVRDNPGGLLDAAIEIVKKFVPKNSLIVSTKGRNADSEKKFLSDEEPIAGDLPMVVLVNEHSASASEIVAGALQDLDRAVVVGNKSFGKGLVQTITGLTYNSSLKITTAKYYTPSGRCIQKIDYMHKGKDGIFSLKPDSLKQHFKTLHGRDVVEAGGIYPDSTVLQDSTNEFLNELVRKAMLFKFAVTYANGNKNLKSDFSVTDNILREFKNYLKDKKFDYKDETEKKLNEIVEIASSKKYSHEFLNEIKLLEKSVKNEKEKDFERNEHEIKIMLENEIIGVAEGQTEQISNSLKYDDQLKTAINILQNRKIYKKFLNIKN